MHHAAPPQLPACAEHLRRPIKLQSPCACSDLLGGSRTSRLYSRLVQAGKAYSADAVPYFPGEKHPNAFLLYALPSDALSLAQLQGAVQEQVQGLAASGPSGQELQRIKKVCPLLAWADVTSSFMCCWLLQAARLCVSPFISA